MNQPSRSPRWGWAKMAAVGLVCLLIGLGFGKWMLGAGPAETTAWRPLGELNNIYAAPSGYNFVESNKGYERDLMALIHDQLYNYDPVQNQLVPGLAKSHEVSSDGRTWTFHLRPAETPDGVRLNAEDVVFSVNLCLDERFNCKRRGNLKVADKYVAAEATGPLTVVFTLSEPYPSFLWAVSELTIVPKTVFSPVAGNVEEFRRAVGVQQPDLKFLAGFGPYRVESQDTQEVRLVPNDRFWGRGDDQNPRPFLKRVVLSLRPAGATTEMDFRQNDRFVYRLVGPGEAERLRDDPNFQVLDRGVSGASMFFWLNQNPKAPWAKDHPKLLELFRNDDFRRALARLIDRNEIVRRVYKGYAEPLYGPISPVFLWAASGETLKDITPTADTAAALAELARLDVVPGAPDEAGKCWLTYAEGGKRVPLVIEIRTSFSEEDLRKKTTEVIAEQLAQAGVQVKVVEEPFSDVVKRLDETFDYEAGLMALEGSPNAAMFRNFFQSSGDMHFPHPYQKPEERMEWEVKVDDQFNVFAASMDPAVQQKALIEMQKAWVATQPAFHLLNDRQLVAVRRDYEVNGFALTGRASDPILVRTVIENVRLRRLAGK
jgi:peptide/nickel transport system substrate-binding protein